MTLAGNTRAGIGLRMPSGEALHDEFKDCLEVIHWTIASLVRVGHKDCDTRTSP